MPFHSLIAGACCLLASAASAAATLHVPRPDAMPQPAAQKAGADLIVHPVRRIGVAVPVDIAVQPSDWTTAQDGMAVWRMQLTSEDASYIGLRLDNPRLPEGAEVRLLGDEEAERGPYTLADRDGRGRLWLALVQGDSARLEIRAPAAAASSVQLGAAELHYGMRPLNGNRPTTKAQGDAGSCHNDVACSEGDDWWGAIPSTAILFIGGELICSGVLLNNTSNNGDPLLITADHCGIRADNSREGFPAHAVQAIFNFQAAQCDSTQKVDLEDGIAGRELLFRDQRADTALIRLEHAPPAHFGARFAGWDASGNGAASGSGIHHPAGDLKKISLFDTPLRAEPVPVSGGGIRDEVQEVEAWRVEWHSKGVTEAGSSGSGIWNPQQQLVGVLSGGSSQCASNGGLLGIGGRPEQSGPDFPDFYGRLAFAFDRDGALGTPLRAFLDPTGKSASRTSDDSAGGGALGLLMPLLLLLAAGRRRILATRTRTATLP